MRLNPAGRETDGIHSPAFGVHVESAKVKCRDVEVADPINAFAELVGVRSIACQAESFVSQGHHVLGVKGLDVSGGSLGPVVDSACGTAIAPGLVGQFPCENSGAARVARHHGLDVGLILGLSGGAGVPSLVVREAVVGYIRSHSTIVAPIVHEVDDELDVVCCGRLHDVVEALKSVGTGVDLRILALHEGLIVDRA